MLRSKKFDTNVEDSSLLLRPANQRSFAPRVTSVASLIDEERDIEVGLEIMYKS